MNQLLKRKNSELTVKKKKGFTLIELIIVIAVIAILAAIALPKFGAAKHNADVAADQANAKIIATAVSTAVANGDITPVDADTSIGSSSYLKYIDGGVLPKAKTGTKAFVVTYGNTNGVIVTNGTNRMYPIS